MVQLSKVLPACGFVIAVALVGVTSSFKDAPNNNNGNQQSYKWFQIAGSYNITDQVSPSDASYLGEGTTPPAGTGCTGSAHQCVSGFDANQVTSSNQLDGLQAPQVTPSKKP